MGFCRAFTQSYRACRGNAGTSRLCHVHRNWYDIWFTYCIQHINSQVTFKHIYTIMNDPYCRYTGSMSSLEEYMDVLYETGPPLTKAKMTLLYEIACRTKKIRSSLACKLWNFTIKNNVNIILTYNNNYFSQFNPGRQEIMISLLRPLIHNESYEKFTEFIYIILKYDIDLKVCISLITATILSIDYREFFFHEKQTIIEKWKKKSLERLDVLHIGISEFKRREYVIEKVFGFLETLSTEIKFYMPGEKRVVPVFEEELLSIVYHPDNFRKLMYVESEV